MAFGVRVEVLICGPSALTFKADRILSSARLGPGYAGAGTHGLKGGLPPNSAGNRRRKWKVQHMSTIGASQFKQECLAILDRLGPEGIVITKHGKPIAKLVPIETDSASLIGSLASKIRVHGDLLSSGLRWDAES